MKGKRSKKKEGEKMHEFVVGVKNEPGKVFGGKGEKNIKGGRITQKKGPAEFKKNL